VSHDSLFKRISLRQTQPVYQMQDTFCHAFLNHVSIKFAAGSWILG